MSHRLICQKLVFLFFLNITRGAKISERFIRTIHDPGNSGERKCPTSKWIFQSCGSSNTYVAKQGDSSSCFCVSTITGQEIPSTRDYKGCINKDTCEQLSRLWSQFMDDKSADLNQVAVNTRNCPFEENNRCQDNFIYPPCNSVGYFICVCPDYYFLNNGACIPSQQWKEYVNRYNPALMKKKNRSFPPPEVEDPRWSE